MTTEAQGKTSNAKISEALELLNEAAREKKEELTGLMANKYAHIREVMTAGVISGKEFLKHNQNLGQEALVKGQEKAKEIASDLDQRVHKDPWPYIAGTAVVSLVLGYLMGSKGK